MNKLSAYEWGLKHKSCSTALENRRRLGKNKTQSDWWKICDRSDWLAWQLDRIDDPQIHMKLIPKIKKIADVILKRNIEKYCLNCGVINIENWAKRWLDGYMYLMSYQGATPIQQELIILANKRYVHRNNAPYSGLRVSDATSICNMYTIEDKNIRAKEREQQAIDIHTEIPEWPGTDW